MLFPLLLTVVGPTAPLPDCGPENGRGQWIRQGDYPVEALRQGQRGSVKFTLTVSPEGCPLRCTVTSSSGWPLLDQRTCQLMLRRAKFEPKLDAEGRRVGAEWSSMAVWDF